MILKFNTTSFGYLTNVQHIPLTRGRKVGGGGRDLIPVCVWVLDAVMVAVFIAPL